ncbi:MAG: Gfo/Idh/MocA family oxidoreductase [Treponema sp.]|jgi:predicted dehydrogenase|nr:Gfo/Idh/MocA family oxidoreductase [Treponema sp.]
MKREMKRTVTVGLIGHGGMGNVHSQCYQDLEGKGVKVIAAADLDKSKREAAAERHGCRVFVTGMELIEKADVDLIDICLPSYLHASHAVAAMEKGAAVITEKPACLTRTDLAKLLKTQERTGVNCGVAQCLRFWDEYEWLAEAVRRKTYGRPLSAVFSRISGGPPPRWFAEWEKSGTAAFDLHIHDVDILCHIFGKPEVLSSMAVRDRKGVLQHIFSAYSCAGLPVTAEAGWNYSLSFPFLASYRVNFEKGDAVFNSAEKPSLVVYPRAGDVFSPEFSSGGAYYRELDYFTSRVREGKKFTRAALVDVAVSVETVLKEIKMAGGMVSDAKKKS